MASIKFMTFLCVIAFITITSTKAETAREIVDQLEDIVSISLETAN